MEQILALVTPQPIHEPLQDFAKQLSRWFSRAMPQPRSFCDVTDAISMGTWLGKREENQDQAVFCRVSSSVESDNFAVIILCDGIGGLRNGGTTARQVASSVITFLVAQEKIQPESLLSAVRFANEDVFLKYRSTSGCTISAVLFTEKQVVATNVGDSRIYWVDQSEAKQLSIDDTIAAHMRLNGASEVQIQPEHHSLVQFVGMGHSLQLSFLTIPSERNGKSILLMSDGAYFIGSALVGRIRNQAVNHKQLLRRVITLAEWMGGGDNATMIAAPATMRVSSAELYSSRVVQVWDPYGSLTVWFERDALKRLDNMSNTITPKQQPKGRRPRRKAKEKELLAKEDPAPHLPGNQNVVLTFGEVSDPAPSRKKIEVETNNSIARKVDVSETSASNGLGGEGTDAH